MTAQTSIQELSYPFGEHLPEIGQLKEVSPGVFWMRLPLPFALDHINVWLLKDEFDGQLGWTLIDTGVARPEQKGIWQSVFEQGLEGLPIVRVLVTHMHPDHVGLAGWLCAHWQAPLWMSMTDYMVASLWAQPPTQTGSPHHLMGHSSAEHYQRHGLDAPELLAQIRQRDSYYSDLVSPLPARFRRLMHGDTFTIGAHQWQAIAGYGHAPEHLSLWCPAANILISGDMLLPRISTNVSVHAYEPEADPLSLYLRSLDEFADVDEQALVLPSHGRPFHGVHVRIQQQREHHQERLQETLEACQTEVGLSAAELVPIMFKRTLDTHQLTFAMGEAIAHLHLLYHDGRIKRRIVDGVYRFYAN